LAPRADEEHDIAHYEFLLNLKHPQPGTAGQAETRVTYYEFLLNPKLPQSGCHPAQHGAE
jgi:hypothetical protein